MSNNDDKEIVAVEVVDTTELDDVNTVPLNISVPPNSAILIVSPHEHGFLFQRQSTVTPETYDMDALAASNLVSTVMWALSNRPDMFEKLFNEMASSDWTIGEVKGHA